MHATLREYCLYALIVIGMPVLLYFLGESIGEQIKPIDAFKLSLLIGLSMLASRGLASYFPKENLATRSLSTLIEQHALLGLIFAAFITLLKEFTMTGPNQSDAKLLISFCISAVFFGGGLFGAALIERRSLNQSETSTKQA